MKIDLQTQTSRLIFENTLPFIRLKPADVKSDCAYVAAFIRAFIMTVGAWMLIIPTALLLIPMMFAVFGNMTVNTVIDTISYSFEYYNAWNMGTAIWFLLCIIVAFIIDLFALILLGVGIVGSIIVGIAHLYKTYNKGSRTKTPNVFVEYIKSKRDRICKPITYYNSKAK